jgi:hypothetical protein
MINHKEKVVAMRTLISTACCALALVIASCTDSPTSTSTVNLGKTTIEAIQSNSAYKGWYETGYETYPSAAGTKTFDSSVAVIKAAFNPAVHKVVMAVKPNCGCQITQIWMPRVMKALDQAGVPHDNVLVYVTDSHLSGIDDIKSQFNIRVAPVFIVTKNDAQVAMIDPTVDLPVNVSIEQALADAFAKP